MASPVPAKSQPLHNFALPQLKWQKNHHSNHLHRRRRPTESPPTNHHQESGSETESGRKPAPPDQVGSSSKKKGLVLDSDEFIDKSDRDNKDKDKSKIYIRLRKNNNKAVVDNNTVEKEEHCSNDNKSPKKDQENNQEKGGLVENNDIEEFVEPKTWNLRPRKPLRKQSSGNNNNGGTIKIQESKAPVRLDMSASNVEKEKKQKFSISLEREEIEEDIFLMTGSRPSRKPKKRAKIVQKQLDNLFPGMWLSSITRDCYKVPDPPMKG